MDNRLLLICLFGCLILAEVTGEITDECLACICQAKTGCNTEQGCINYDTCGPFLIMKEYWEDAGAPVKVKGLNAESNDSYDSFISCVTDLECASETIRSYSRIYKRDCDGDGQITCEDYMQIHLFGPDGCKNPGSGFNSPYYKEFWKCKVLVNPK